ncbi:MAG TPA: hypothetical protein PK286_07190 [Devosia sp.]|nr:hypothetical protein [Devosia sp.]
MERLPHSEQEQVQAALDDILSWPPLARSPQLGRFLSYIVAKKLDGGDSQIKAYAIAVDVFGRPASFDAQSDPIVRVQARRLRALIEQYNAEGNGAGRVRIHLPVGRYVPEFLFDQVQAAPAPVDPVPPPAPLEKRGSATVSVKRRPEWVAYAALASGVLALAVGLGVFATRQQAPVEAGAPTEPVVVVGQFANLSGSTGLDPFGPQISSAVEETLAPFEELGVQRADAAPAGDPARSSAFVLTGIIHPAPPGIEVAATLSDPQGNSVWNATYAEPQPNGREIEVAAMIARAIAREVAAFRGPVHAGGRAWLNAQQRPLPAISTYVCLLAYHVAREAGVSGQIADALACAERLLKAEPDNALGLAISAWLETRSIVSSATPGVPMAPELKNPLEMATQAVQFAPESSLAFEQRATVNSWLQNYDQAERDFVRSLALNPLNANARAGYAMMLGGNLHWSLGSEQAAIAIADIPEAPPWFHYPIAFNDFRERRYAEALEAAQEAMRFGGGEAGVILAFASAQALGRNEVIEELRPRLMAAESLRRAGIMPWFATRTSDPEMLALVAVALRRAGVPAAALTSAF